MKGIDDIYEQYFADWLKQSTFELSRSLIDWPWLATWSSESSIQLPNEASHFLMHNLYRNFRAILVTFGQIPDRTRFREEVWEASFILSFTGALGRAAASSH